VLRLARVRRFQLFGTLVVIVFTRVDVFRRKIVEKKNFKQYFADYDGV
jgi:hypothetical protein